MVSNELNRWRLLVATYNTIKRQFYGMEHTVEGSLSLKYMESGIFKKTGSTFRQRQYYIVYTYSMCDDCLEACNMSVGF
jgi:hypothetical protein